jgi:hypothetical protein
LPRHTTWISIAKARPIGPAAAETTPGAPGTSLPAGRGVGLADPELRRRFGSYRSTSEQVLAATAGGDRQLLALKHEEVADAHRALQRRKRELMGGH